MTVRRWETDTRFYMAWIETDLLGDWVLMTVHGGLKNRLGGVRARVVASEEDGQKALAAIAKVREKHHYKERVGWSWTT